MKSNVKSFAIFCFYMSLLSGLASIAQDATPPAAAAAPAAAAPAAAAPAAATPAAATPAAATPAAATPAAATPAAATPAAATPSAPKPTGETVATVEEKVITFTAKETYYKVGDKVFTLSPEGKKVGAFVINKIEDKTVTGELSAGKILVGMSIFNAPKTGDKKEKTAKAKLPSDKKVPYIGVIGGLSMNTMNMVIGGKYALSLTGTSFNGRATYDYPVLSKLDMRLGVGLDTFTATGKNVNLKCKCTVDVNYLAFTGLGKYFLYKKIWLGVGGAYEMVLTSASDVLNKIDSNYNIQFGGGFDFPISGGTKIIPVEVIYALYQTQATVALNQIHFRTGFAMSF